MTEIEFLRDQLAQTTVEVFGLKKRITELEDNQKVFKKAFDQIVIMFEKL